MSAALQGFKTKADNTLKSAGGMSLHLHRHRAALRFHRVRTGWATVNPQDVSSAASNLPG